MKIDYNRILILTSCNISKFLDAKIKGGFDCRKRPIELELAINNSTNNFEAEKEQPKLFSTEVHLLGLKILPFVKTQLDKLRKIDV